MRVEALTALVCLVREPLPSGACRFSPETAECARWRAFHRFRTRLVAAKNSESVRRRAQPLGVATTLRVVLGRYSFTIGDDQCFKIAHPFVQRAQLPFGRQVGIAKHVGGQNVTATLRIRSGTCGMGVDQARRLKELEKERICAFARQCLI